MKSLKCLVLSKTQRYSVYCQRGVKKILNIQKLESDFDFFLKQITQTDWSIKKQLAINLIVENQWIMQFIFAIVAISILRYFAQSKNKISKLSCMVFRIIFVISMLLGQHMLYV